MKQCEKESSFAVGLMCLTDGDKAFKDDVGAKRASVVAVPEERKRSTAD